MRTTLLAFSTACVLLTTVNHATAAPSPDSAVLPPVETLNERNPDRWQGRHHYLYDDENRPDSATTGAAPSDARACANEPVRLRRSDGTTVVRRLKRCD
jgi:hypothetical protein